MAFETDKDLALEVCKQWLREMDASYLAKEDVFILWEGFNPESKKGSWVKYKVKEACRIIKATRAGFAAMRFIKPDVLLMAAQEEGRAFKQAVKSRSTTPPEYFNLERAGHFNEFELLTVSLLQELVGRGWNIEALCLGDLMKELFQTKGFAVPNRMLRWKLLRAVADEGGMVIRDRTNRITITGVGRFVALQIEGFEDSIKQFLNEEEKRNLIDDTIRRFKNY